MIEAHRPLYSLLPGYYRQQDIAQDYALRQVFEPIEDQFRLLAADIEQLYDNWFIETCQDVMVPHIGVLVGVGAGPLGRPPSRLEVAGAIASRRRKGTPAALLSTLVATTGWGAMLLEHPPKVVLEFSEEIDIVETPDWIELEEREFVRLEIQSPFGSRVEDAAAGGERGDPRGAISVFLWPRPCTPREWTRPHHMGGGRFTFDARGIGQPLYNVPVRSSSLYAPVTPRTLPLRLTRRLLQEELAALRAGQKPRWGFFLGEAVFQIRTRSHPDQDWKTVPPTAINIANLADWRAEPCGYDWEVAVDPESGRILFPSDCHGELAVTWCTVSPALLDGGSSLPPLERPRLYSVFQACQALDGDGSMFHSVEAALAAVAAAPPGNALIRILDGGTYAAPHDEILLPEGYTLRLEAAQGECPSLAGTWRFHAPEAGSALQLQGLSSLGSLETHGPVLLTANRCILRPASEHSHAHALRAEGGKRCSAFHLHNCITGSVELPEEGSRLVARSTILDAGRAVAIRAGTVVMQQCTVFGLTIAAALVDTSDTFFGGPVELLSETAAMSFCALPQTSSRMHLQHCFLYDHEHAPGEWFYSARFGEPGYAHLSHLAPTALQAGAADGSEIGAYHELGERAAWHRIENVLDEYLPFGLAADVFLVT